MKDDAGRDLVHSLEQRWLRIIRGSPRTGFAGKRRQEFRELQPAAANDFLAANALREQVRVNTLLRGENDGALDHIFQLANVAGPVVIHHELHRRRRELPQRLSIFVAIALEKISQQKRHIFPPLAQRRNLQVDDVQAVAQIFTKTAFAYQSNQFDVGSGHDAHVDFELLSLAEAHEIALLNDAQNLALRFRADSGDFIEENGALIGNFEEPFLGGNCASEGALHMAKELGLQQINGNRSCVYGHESFVRAGGSEVNRLGDEFLAGAAFAANKNSGA